MPRSRSFALVYASFAWVFGIGSAAAQPMPHPPRVPHPIYGERIYGERGEAGAFHHRNAGAIDGQVVSIDYRTGTMTVHTQHRGLMDVVVLPSTSIQASENGFHTIADIVRGERVHVFLSQRGDHFFAEIINLK
jgi:hypothetical protein